MTQARVIDLVTDAAKTRAGIGAFNVIQLELAEAIVEGAEMAGRPTILQISQNCVLYHGSLAPIASASLALARQSEQPIGVNLDHATEPSLVAEALDLGIDSVMFDASTLSDQANRASTAAVVAMCHRRGVSVEAELGEIGGKDGVHAPGARTDPEQAAAFVEATGVDALAVAVGSSHGMTRRTAALDFDLIAALRAKVPVPLVLHGSSGVADADLAKAVTAGLTKINIGTLLNQTLTESIRATLANNPAMVNTRKYLGPARRAVAQVVAGLIGLLAGGVKP
ncbi:MAG: class II fructose-bisphosphate aldolase [Micrococcales bacterium]|nr:class II fructose-bisphosphate aldolase [Micrococcales bacterium]